MRAALSAFEAVRPRDLDHALHVLSESTQNGRIVPIAGGTDLFVYLNAGTPPGTRYLDLWNLRELRGIEIQKQSVVLGAITTFREIRIHATIQRRFPSLVAAAAEVGALQIQNRATLGGNIANASPAGDSLPVLLAHDAIVQVRSTRGARDIPFEHLYRGYRELVTEPDELITSVTLPLPAPRAHPFFRKVGTRRAQSISKVVFCGLIARERDGRITTARLAYGSVAPVPMRARGAEDVLMGERPSRGLLGRAREALLEDIAPIDDIRSDREYRMAIAGNVLEQFLRTFDAQFARS